MSEDKVGYRRFDFSMRCELERLLAFRTGFSQIARTLGVSPSSVTREVVRNRTEEHRRQGLRRVPNHCALRRTCEVRHLCAGCHLKRCASCQSTRCGNVCGEYVAEVCRSNDHAPYVCNGCDRKSPCTARRYVYSSKVAQQKAAFRARSSREGIDMDREGFAEMVELVGGLLAKNQSLSQIWCAHASELPCSERTFYRYVEMGVGGLCNMHLPKKVVYKRRRRKVVAHADPAVLAGRRYSDWEALGEEERMATVQVDCVEGALGDERVLLTLFFVRFRFQLVMLLDHHTRAEVVGALDALEALAPERYPDLFGVLLADRGHEFLDAEGIESSADGRRRSRVYYCDARHPEQKGACEKNHVEIRKVIPKGRSLDSLHRGDVALLSSHVNSALRASLGGRSPLQLASSMIPPELLEGLGLAIVPPDDVNLSPSLLQR